MKLAEEISAKFQNYQVWVEAWGFHIKRFRCDNGSGEYNNSVFLTLLGEKGIAYEPAPPYTQHKNGVAERMIWTLNTKVRSMMWEANVLTKFWSEAIRTACYLHRRSPTTSLSGNRFPFKAYSEPSCPSNIYIALDAVPSNIYHQPREMKRSLEVDPIHQ